MLPGTLSTSIPHLNLYVESLESLVLVGSPPFLCAYWALLCSFLSSYYLHLHDLF